MKKIKTVIAVFILCAVLVMSSCESGNGGIEITLAPETTGSTASGTRTDVYALTVNGVSIAPHDRLSEYLSALGNPAEYYESESCAYLGLDKIYVFTGFRIDTYPDNGVDYILQISFTDDSLTTDEGIRIGDTVDKVVAAYGTGYSLQGDSYSYTRGNTVIMFNTRNGAVADIQYIANS